MRGGHMDEALDAGCSCDSQQAGSGKTVYLESVHRVCRTVSRIRSEEHTSELQSQSNLVCRLLLEKKHSSSSSHSSITSSKLRVTARPSSKPRRWSSSRSLSFGTFSRTSSASIRFS